MKMKKHSPKFKIEKRGSKSKYYTCKICGLKITEWNKKNAIEIHNQYINNPQSTKE
jgi:hypothetical protein